jgi:molybdopterin/thiamine biosynthesis adenylyltransferase
LSSEDYLARVRGRVDVERLSTQRVVQVGIGTVGSAIAAELAACGVQEFCLVDGDVLEEQNISRHELKRAYVDRNKAEAMASFLEESYPPGSLTVTAVPRHVDGSMSDDELDDLVEGADVVIAATDDRSAQRRVAARALANDVPAVFPALYENGGGEVFISLGPDAPCLLCWEQFRPEGQALRAVSALRVETTSIASLGVQLTVGLLDRSSDFARLFAHRRQDRTPPTLFVLARPHAAIEFARVNRVANCAMCQVGPAPSRVAALNGLAARHRVGQAVGPRENETLLGSGLVFLTLLFIAAATTNAVAIVLLVVASTIGPYIVLRPNAADTISWARQNDFISVLIGLADLALLVFSLAWRTPELILLLGVALAASSAALFSRRESASRAPDEASPHSDQ